MGQMSSSFRLVKNKVLVETDLGLILAQADYLLAPRFLHLESAHNNCANLTKLLQSLAEEIYLNLPQIVNAQ